MIDPMKKNLKVDPLFQLFEHHLVSRSYEDSGKFTKELAAEYLAYIDTTLAHVPFKVRQTVTEDLEAEAHEMLVKKMYGTMRATDYVNFGGVVHVTKEEMTWVSFTPKAKTLSE